MPRETVMFQKIGAVCLCSILASCSSVDPIKYADLPTASYLQKSSDDDEHVHYQYSTNVSWSSYRNVIVSPVTLYQGADHQFGDMPEQEKIELAQYMQTQFSKKLASRFNMVAAPTAQTLRINLVLTGAAKTSALLGPFTRFDIGGGLYNGAQSVRGGEGLFTGSVLYAVEIYDAMNSQLLASFIEKQYPNAYNIGATFGALAAAKTGIEKGAERLTQKLSTPEG